MRQVFSLQPTFLRMNFFQLLFPDFSLILTGYLVCRFTSLNRAIWSQVETLVYFFFFPVLLFHSIIKSPLDLGNTSSLVLAGWSMGLGGIAMAYALPYLPGLRQHIAARDFAGSAQVAFRFNAYVALALANKLAGAPGLAAIALLIGISVPLMNIGAVWPMARHGGRGFLRELVRNPLILATGSGLIANFLGLSIPDFLDTTVSRIGSTALSLGLMAAGAGLQFGALQKSRALTVSLLSIRHILMPLWALVLAYLFHLPQTQASMLLAFAAVPTASSCYVLAVRMGYDGSYIAGLVTLSTVLGIASLPFAIGVLLPLLS